MVPPMRNMDFGSLRIDAGCNITNASAFVTVKSYWSNWVNDSTSATTDSPWTVWIGNTTTVSTATTVWGNWYPRAIPMAPPPPESPEVIQARRDAVMVRAAADRERRMEREAQQARASERAKETLLEFLSPSQRDEYQRVGRFHCQDRSGKRYAILPRKLDGVIEYEGNKPAGMWCVHEVGMPLPIEDTMLAQKLAIEAGGEEELRRVAFHRPYHVGDLQEVH